MKVKRKLLTALLALGVAGFSAAGSLALSVPAPCRGSVGRGKRLRVDGLERRKVYRDGLETRERKLDGRQF